MMMPHEITMLMAARVKAKRLTMNLSQVSLAEHSGVSYGTLKKFERTGQISLESLLKLERVPFPLFFKKSAANYSQPIFI